MNSGDSINPAFGAPVALNRRALALGVVGAIKCAFGLAILFGYFAGLKAIYGWTPYVKLSLSAAAALTALGLAVLTVAWRRDCCQKTGIPRWLPVPIAVGIATATLTLWEGLPHAHSPLAVLTLASGIAMALVLPVLTYLAHTSHLRAVHCEEANTRLRHEIAERRRAEDSLRTSEEFNRRIIESNNDCVQLLDLDGGLIFINQRGQALMEVGGLSEMARRPWAEGFGGIDRNAALEALATARKGKNANFHGFYPTAKGTPKWWNFILVPILAANGAVERLLVIARDMTEHMQVEKALRESEEAFRKIFEEGPIGMVLAGPDLRIAKVNNAFSRMLGYSESELIGSSFTEITFPEDAESDRQQTERMVRGEIPNFQIEKRYVTKRKEVIWGHLTISMLRDPEGRPLHAVAMIENVNERKNAEERFLAYQEQLQSLASKLSLSEERERREIATNLHDRIGQTLAFAKLKLGALNQEGIGGKDLLEVRGLIEQAMADTRSLTFELSPPVLYELGLVAALEWLARNIQQEHGIATMFHDDGQPKPLHEDFRIVLFQAVRELLVNIVKHSRSTHAQILLRRDGDALRIIIEDDGVGFEPALIRTNIHSSTGFGLFNIRERLDYLGGQVNIRSEPGRGTRITLLAPLKLEERPPET